MRDPSVATFGRRAVLSSSAALSAVFSTLALGPLPALSISATTMTGKTKPELGIVLLDEVSATGKSISANVILDGGLIATPTFSTKWPLAEGGYYDIEASTRDGETAYLQVAPLGKGESFATLPKTWFANALFAVDGRYGAYGAPSDVKLKEIDKDGTARTFEVAFTVLSPGMSELPRKGLVRAIQPPGSTDVLMLLCSAGPTRWAKNGADAEARSTIESFRIASTAPTALKREASADYRYGKTSGPSTMKSRNDGF